MSRLNHLVSPPRKIPFSSVLKVLFAGHNAQLKWWLYSAAMLFAFIMLGGLTTQTQDRILNYFSRPQIVSGTILEVDVGETKQSGLRVARYRFRYRVGGHDFETTQVTKNLGYSNGDAAEVSVPSGKPELGMLLSDSDKPVEMYNGSYGTVVLLVGPFMLLGLGVLSIGLSKAFDGLEILRHGQVTYGELVSERLVSHPWDEGPKVMAYEFVFRVPNDNLVYHLNVVGEENLNLKDEAKEPILYLPVNPNRALAVDALPGGVRISKDGEIAAGWLFISAWYCLGPIVASSLTLWTVLSVLVNMT